MCAIVQAGIGCTAAHLHDTWYSRALQTCSCMPAHRHHCSPRPAPRIHNKRLRLANCNCDINIAVVAPSVHVSVVLRACLQHATQLRNVVLTSHDRAPFARRRIRYVTKHASFAASLKTAYSKIYIPLESSDQNRRTILSCCRQFE